MFQDTSCFTRIPVYFFEHHNVDIPINYTWTLRLISVELNGLDISQKFWLCPCKIFFHRILRRRLKFTKNHNGAGQTSDLICTVSLCQAIDTLIGKRVITSFLSKYNKSSMTRRISDILIVCLSIYLSIYLIFYQFKSGTPCWDLVSH
jgi:hypothetical protein